MKSEKNVPNEHSERFADVKVDKKYRIKFLEEENLQIVKAVITENNIKKKFLKFETLKDKTIYTCNYDSIKDATQLSTLLRNRIFWSAFILLIITTAISALVDYATGDSGFAKPIIYLYPTETTTVSVKVGYPEKFTHTYPHYQSGWHVTAQPNGDLTDLATGRHLYALYWEGVDSRKDTAKEGFVVKGEDTISFLEDKLSQLGLSEREADEFIIYWLPKLEGHPYNYIRFQTIEEQNIVQPLDITPKPDTLIRVMMEYANLNEFVEVKEQKLPNKPERNGFTVVEWGGTETSL